jgi:L-alanine-DL-glutamate epimerase-like enolase superfamily enzyme
MAPSLLTAWERLAALTVEVERIELERLEQQVSSGFKRVTTLIHMHGRGEEGVGEDVTYVAELHDGQAPPRELEGTRSLGELCDAVGSLDLFPVAPEHDVYRSYRRWGWESAALDLALRQAGTSFAEALEREPRPVTFVMSSRLGDPPTADIARRWLELYPTLRFKLDPTPTWDDGLIADLAGTGAVDTLDLKGAYRGTAVDNPPDAELYRRVAEGFPGAWIEDPGLAPDTDAALEPHRDRVTWDAVIHSVEDVEALPFAPRALNSKPSRFGSIRELFRFYDHCAELGISLYGGGQFELGPGRGHIQYLAALLHADTPNDVAPGGYNSPEPRPGLLPSPLDPAPAPTGFGWGATRR